MLANYILLLAVLIPAIFFLVTERNVLSTIKRENRGIAPSFVWVQLFPLVGQVVQFVVVTEIAKAIRKELLSTKDESIFGISDAAVDSLRQKPTLAIGLAYCICNLLGMLLSAFFSRIAFLSRFAPLLRGIGSLLIWAGMICWIVYWVKLVKYKRLLSPIRK